MTSKSRLSEAVWTGFTESLRFIVVPIILVDLVTSNYPGLETAFIDNLEMFIMFFGGMIVASGVLEVTHRPGTYKRLLFGLTALIFVGMWLFVVFGGGIAEFAYGPYFVSFDMSKIVYIILIGLSLKSVLVVMTFSNSRREEIERARKRRLELAQKQRAAVAANKRAQAAAAARAAPMVFHELDSAEFDVTADDDVGYTPAPYMKDLPKGMKICEVCGAQSPTKFYVCRNCGAWFPNDSVV